jgi:hypothetical protein
MIALIALVASSSLANSSPIVRVEAGGLPAPLSYGGEIDVYAPPFWLKADGIFNAGWSVNVAAPIVNFGPFTAGPLAGIGQPWYPGVCADSCNSQPGPYPGRLLFAIGIAARWESEYWWVTLAPTYTRLIDGFADPGLIAPLETGPPAIEIGWKPTSHWGLALRTSVAPIVAAYTF